ncbi:MAG: ABC transporter permease, partial [Planctomycetaceae bacterium]|nr:ABC transporter permease [Planctomycetaceae bacterium]
MYKLLLCVRYLRTRYIALASIISVMLGVATMIVVNSVMAGFTSEMRDRIKGVLADVVVEARSMDGIEDSKAQMAVIEEAAGEFIAAMTPTVEVPAMVTYNDPVTGETFTQPIQLIGI